jgi:hypothetical protein
MVIAKSYCKAVILGCNPPKDSNLFRDKNIKLERKQIANY